jgi:hypothetical protein
MKDLAAMIPSSAPPPSPALLERVGRIGPVRTRRPGGALVAATLLSAVAPAYLLHLYPVRRDMGALPRWWLLVAGLLWAGMSLLLLARAILPRRGDVLPNAARAARTAAVSSLLLIAFGLAFTIDSSCCTIVPAMRWADFAAAWWHCVSFGLRITAPTLVVGGVFLRRLALAGGGRLGMAVGAAGGALAGLTLHLLCPIGGALHVALAHGGGVLIGAVLGGAVLGTVLARDWRRAHRP